MPRPTRPSVAAETTEYLDPAATKAALGAHMRARPSLEALANEAARLGYRPREEDEQFFGYRHSFRAARPVRPPAGATAAEPVEAVEVEVLLQSHSKPDSTDQAAIVTLSIKGGGNSESYDLLLEAPGGSFHNYREFTASGVTVQEAESWWSAFVSCLDSNCWWPCLSALWQCTGTWAAYLACLAARCGGCVGRCLTCATCNCGWWCSWASGCCRQ